LSDLKPKLRPVEAFPIERDGQQWIALYDPSGFAEGIVTLTPHAFFIVSRFDGRHSILDIQAAFARSFGQLLLSEQILGLARRLDEALLLDSERFRTAYRKRAEEFVNSDVRPYRQQGLPEKERLEAIVDRILSDRQSQPSARGILTGLVAPHLDYERGFECYRLAYGLLSRLVADGFRPRRIVLLGTNHFPSVQRPVACDKDYLTPFGKLRADRDAIGRLCDSCGFDLLEGQYDHAFEHSVELQAIILGRLFREAAPETIPLLCPDPLESDTRQMLDALADALRQWAADVGQVLFIAGADLSHVGPRFGDDRPLSRLFLKLVERVDREALGLLARGRADDFLHGLRQRSNETRICSAGALYLLRRALPDAAWQELGYHQAVTEQMGTCVTCCAAALWSND